MAERAHPHISVVIPLYNEADNLGDLHRELTAALGGPGREYEILLVDDGSTDATREKLLALEEHDPRVRAVLLRRNFGQTAAFSAGFDRARGALVVTSDGDLQNDPADIPALVAKLEAEDLDMVCGWRAQGRGPLSKRVPSFFPQPPLPPAHGGQLPHHGCRPH